MSYNKTKKETSFGGDIVRIKHKIETDSYLYEFTTSMFLEDGIVTWMKMVEKRKVSETLFMTFVGQCVKRIDGMESRTDGRVIHQRLIGKNNEH